MKRERVLKHEFVEYIPADLKDGTIYVSMTYAIVIHNCCCGCGNKVITPLSPTDWKLIFDGQSISLDPSIGNWSFPCQSHYWITRDTVRWARQWSREEIEEGRAQERLAKERYFGSTGKPTVALKGASPESPGEDQSHQTLWRKLKRWWFTDTA